MGSLSIREYIRWLPDDASEPTSTLVVTSPKRHFVDIRANRPEDAPRDWPEKEVNITPEQLDWAIAGRSSYWKPDKDSERTRGRWEHWIDSRTIETDGLADEGDNYSQTDGTTLEKGIMVNPATGKDTEYEELWRDVDPVPAGSENARCAVIQFDEGKSRKGCILLVGQSCQGLIRDGDDITVERWEYSESSGWRRLIALGSNGLPCLELIKSDSLTEGETLSLDGRGWKVVEASGY